MSYRRVLLTLSVVGLLCIPAWLHADCSGEACQGTHTASAGGSAPDGNCCKDGTLDAPPGPINQQGCDGYRNYWWQDRTEKLKNLTHSGTCVNTVEEPCIPCSAGQGQQLECPALLTEATHHWHQLWQMGYGIVYAHYWRTGQVNTDCNCGKHGC
jgi:hypothetical protein